MLKEKRQSVAQREEKQEKMLAALLAFAPYQQADTVSFYAAIGSEPLTQRLIATALAQGKTVCLPRVEDGEMHMIPLAPDTVYTSGQFGISQPVGEPIHPQSLALCVCPGLGFSLSGARLGYGGGYYDRYLAKTQAFPLGICYTATIAELLCVEPWDVPMRALLTENGIIEMESST